jgi:hypothetical protein
MRTGFIVTGFRLPLTRPTGRVFYTGRAGDGFVSTYAADAFTYATQEEAARKAVLLSEAGFYLFFIGYASQWDEPRDMFKQLRIAATLTALYDDYCAQIRSAMICPPNGRAWLVGVIRKGMTGEGNSPRWVPDAHPGLYADLQPDHGG